MSRERLFTSIGLLLGLLGCSVAVVSNEMTFRQRSLRGLHQVAVRVESLPSHIEQEGLTQRQLLNEVEVRLQKAGIRMDGARRTPFLYLNVNVVKGNTGLYAYSIQLSLKERVALERDPSVRATATTWEAVGGVGVASHLRSVRKNVGGAVDDFINDYLAVNPKGTARD